MWIRVYSARHDDPVLSQRMPCRSHFATRTRGSVLIMAMVLVATLAMMTSVFASRILANQRRMETDIAAARALELAQSANDWNMV